MNEQHETRLAILAEKLADVFLEEADPSQWPGAAVAPAERSKEHRGDRNWELRNANQVGLLLARVIELRARVKWVRQSEESPDDPPPPPPGGTLGNADPEADMQRFEREAAAVLDRVQRRGK